MIHEYAEYTMSSEQDEIDIIMDNFDFYKIKKVMDILDWRWTSLEGQSGVPLIAEMRSTSRRLLKKAIENTKITSNKSIVATGGFVAEAHIEDENLYLNLSFIAEEFCNH